MISFGLITEGSTDQAVISNILSGYFNNINIPINSLQPLRDETDKKRYITMGGWSHVIDYCKSNKFSEAFQFYDYIIIHLDTDICEEYKVSKFDNSGRVLLPYELISEVIKKLVNNIGQDIFNKINKRTIFAISVHSIECWLLPIFYSDKKREKTTSCLNTLNQILIKKYGYTIDKNNKIFSYYQDISKPYIKNKNLKKYYKHNPSFKIFIDKLDVLDIKINE
ncbi:hypothetical protein ES705_27465 [subsurface metagenome]